MITKNLTLPVTGMTCASCASRIERGLKKVMVTNQSFTAKDTWTGEDRDEAVPDVQSAKII